MQHRKLKVGLSGASALAATALVLAAQPAYADYAPVAKDVVGVGSDTVQYAGDFVADGDPSGDLGFNSTGVKFKIINFDATPDANARLAYGPDGAGTSCAPGTGSTAGTGGQTAKHADSPCTLNPTLVLRAGTSPVQRPNGSGGGAKAIATDTHHYISYTRASAPQGATLNAGNQGNFDSITVGNDNLAMLAASTTNAVPLSKDQLNAIYACSSSTRTWNQVGGSSSDSIIPIIPQVGSGTRSTFLADIGNPTLGSCVVTGEENDPTAIAAQGAAGAPDAIEPMSSGRLNLYQGLDGSNNATGAGGYFKDPSCALNAIAASTPSACASSADTLNPAVKQITTGTPSGTDADAQPVYTDLRPLFIYFRNSDVTSSATFEPGGTLNFVRTLFYNPCPDNPPVTGDGCTTSTVAGQSFTFGPGGAPFYATGAGQALVSAAGIAPTYRVTLGGP
jgi:hypothetical protein